MHTGDDCLQELRWVYDRCSLTEARRDLAAWLQRWQGTYPKLTNGVEENIGSTLTFYRTAATAPQAPEGTNMLA